MCARTTPLALALTRFEPSEGVLPAVAPGALDRGAWLGVDIGSTTTKFALLDPEGRILAKRYVPTRGRPIEVARGLVAGLREEVGGAVRLLGVATTGSGRQVVGDFLDADLVIDEITAHARGAVEADAAVDTIFEIGGQDAKYISLEGRHARDFDMNKVCAAGTGSFLHELAAKLGVDIVGEFERTALAARRPVQLAERCTVFMESDLVSAAQRGASREDLIGGLAYAVVRNYLNRVVGKRAVGRRVMFLGGPSLNRAVVAAFERVLGRGLAVPAHREVMGAIGAALAARDAAARGEIAPAPRTLAQIGVADAACRERVCRADPACRNECKLRVYDFGGRASVWGGECGRYETGRRGAAAREDFFAERARRFAEALAGAAAVPSPRTPAPERPPAGTIGVPLALHGLGWGVFWAHLLAGLGWRVVLSPPTDERISRAGVESMTAETCYPVKVFHGHVRHLLAHAERLFLPNVITVPAPAAGERGLLCPYVEASQYMVNAALALDPGRVVRPTLFLAEGPEAAARDLLGSLPPAHRPSRRRLAALVRDAWERQEAFVRSLERRGEEVLAGTAAGRAGLGRQRAAVQPLRRTLQPQDRQAARGTRRHRAAAGLPRARRRGPLRVPRHVLGPRRARPARGAARRADPEPLRRAPDELRLRRRLVRRALLPPRGGGEAGAGAGTGRAQRRRRPGDAPRGLPQRGAQPPRGRGGGVPPAPVRA